MVATGQIVNLLLLAGGVYIAIEYGPQIITWFKTNVQKIGDSLPTSGDTTPSETTPPSPPSETTPYVPFTDNQSSAPPSSPNIPLSGGPPPTKQAPKKAELQQRLQVSNTPFPGSVPYTGPDTSSSSPSMPPPIIIDNGIPTPRKIPVAKPAKKKADVYPSNYPDPKKPFESQYPPVTLAKKPTISSRFQRGSIARTNIDLNLGCRCANSTCCFRGRKCDGQMGSECANTKDTNKTTRDSACASLRARFVSKNQCNAKTPAKLAPVTPKGVTPRPKPSDINNIYGQWHGGAGFPNPPVRQAAPGEFQLNPTANAGFAYGDKGQLISLESLSVTVA